MQTTIAGTQDINKQSFLKAIADHIVTSPGSPRTGEQTAAVPADFGLAASDSTAPFELDIDKVSRLNSLNSYSLSYFDMANAAKLSNIALGIAVTQVMSIDIQQLSNSTNGENLAVSFSILTSVESKPTSASLNCYAVANNYVTDVANSSSDGLGLVTIQIPIADAGNALLVVFARASCDDRITSYGVYDFASSSQQTAPNNQILTLSPLNYNVSYTSNSSGITGVGGSVFSFNYQKNLDFAQGAVNASIPQIIR